MHQADLVDEHVWLLSEGHCFRTQVLHLCSVDRRRPVDASSVRFDGGSFETLAAIVDAGLGMTILPELTVRQLAPTRQARAQITEAIFRTTQSALPPESRRPQAQALVRPQAGVTGADLPEVDRPEGPGGRVTCCRPRLGVARRASRQLNVARSRNSVETPVYWATPKRESRKYAAISATTIGPWPARRSARGPSRAAGAGAARGQPGSRGAPRGSRRRSSRG